MSEAGQAVSGPGGREASERLAVGTLPSLGPLQMVRVWRPSPWGVDLPVAVHCDWPVFSLLKVLREGETFYAILNTLYYSLIRST